MAKTPKRSHVKMIGKLVGSVLGTRIAERSGQSGALGAMAGFFASKYVRRSPIGALVVGGAWLGHKLYKRHQEREFEQAAKAAKPARTASPMKAARPASTTKTVKSAKPRPASKATPKTAAEPVPAE